MKQQSNQINVLQLTTVKINTFLCNLSGNTPDEISIVNTSICSLLHNVPDKTSKLN